MEVTAVKKALRILLSCVLMAVFLFSTAKALRQMEDKANGSSTYEEALQIALSGDTGSDPTEKTQPEETAAAPSWIPAPIEGEDVHVQTLESLSLDTLREVNPDVLGWILIPDTMVNYPILQSEDNDYYLNRTWEGKKNSVGSIFLECSNTPDFTDFNTIVYGHNMRDGSMFAQIREYGNPSFREQHPFIYIRTDAGVFRYEIFSSYEAPVDSTAYRLGFSSENARSDFLAGTVKHSCFDAGILPEETDRILTLSTCSGRGYSTRWVAHARLKMIPAETR